MVPEPRPDGKIVQLAVCESFIEAEAVIAQLDDAGIKASRGADEGSLPNLAAAGGYPVLVFEDDLEAARAAIDADDAASPA
jgi:hypothetical protein